MNEKLKIAVVRALIGAIVPPIISELIKFVKSKHGDIALEDMVDRVDWDAEYEALLEQEDMKRKPWWKRIRK